MRTSEEAKRLRVEERLEAEFCAKRRREGEGEKREGEMERTQGDEP